MIVRTDVPVVPGVKETRAGVNEVVRPLPDGVDVAVRATMPVNPRLLRVMVVVVDPPATSFSGVGRTETVKSGRTCTDSVVL